MLKMLRHAWVLRSSIVVVALVVGILFVLLYSHGPQAHQPLRIDRVATNTGDSALVAGRTNVIPDDVRQMYSPTRRVEFVVSSTNDTSIFVLATGVQMLTESGWQVVSEERRGEIWRLKTGVAREVCVERPDAGVWRAYFRYGTAMKGLPLLNAEMKEAWLNRSLSNWNGKAWGGGRWSGAFEVYAPQVEE